METTKGVFQWPTIVNYLLERRDPKGGSFSSLMNILTAMKKTSMQKSASESRKKLDSISKQSHRSKSEIDLAAVPGSCSNIKSLFEANDNRLVNDISAI